MNNLQKTVASKLEQMTTLKYFTFCGYARNCWFLLLKALNIEPGDEVIVPGFACQSIYQAVYDVGASPIFVDVDINSINISPNGIEKSITSKTKVIYVIHAFGISAEIEKISKIAKDHSIYLVEDISHSLNGIYDYKKLGSYGHFAICSLTKTMINYQGGFIATNDHNIHIKIRDLQLLCQPLNPIKKHFSYYVYRLLCSLWECNGSFIAWLVFKMLEYFKGETRIPVLHSITCDFGIMSQLALYITDKQLSRQISHKYIKKRNKNFYKFKHSKKGKINFPQLPKEQIGLMPNHHCGIIDSKIYKRNISLSVWSNTDVSENLVNSKELYEKLRLFSKGI